MNKPTAQSMNTTTTQSVKSNITNQATLKNTYLFQPSYLDPSTTYKTDASISNGMINDTHFSNTTPSPISLIKSNTSTTRKLNSLISPARKVKQDTFQPPSDITSSNQHMKANFSTNQLNSTTDTHIMSLASTSSRTLKPSFTTQLSQEHHLPDTSVQEKEIEALRERHRKLKRLMGDESGSLPSDRVY